MYMSIYTYIYISIYQVLSFRAAHEALNSQSTAPAEPRVLSTLASPVIPPVADFLYAPVALLQPMWRTECFFKMDCPASMKSVFYQVWVKCEVLDGDYWPMWK